MHERHRSPTQNIIRSKNFSKFNCWNPLL
ncbi:hypothetical protein NECAME_07799, partial [Necator americanus]